VSAYTITTQVQTKNEGLKETLTGLDIPEETASLCEVEVVPAYPITSRDCGLAEQVHRICGIDSRMFIFIWTWQTSEA
jgi:hypothetical protein